MSSTPFKVKTPIPVKPINTTTQNPSSIMSFLDDSKNVNFQYSSISSQSSQRDVKPKACFSVSKTNGALVDYM